MAVAIVAGISACSKNGESSDQISNPTVTTQIQIEAKISRLLSYGYTELIYFINIQDNGLPVRGTLVTVNGIIVPSGVGGPDDYSHELREYSNVKPSYFPGQIYTVSVVYNGKTYTETEKAPGGITANSDFTKVEWVHSGKYAGLDVRHMFGSTTYFVPKTRPGPLTSPQTIPTTAYPSPGNYIVTIGLQNIKSKSFGTLSGDRCYLDIVDCMEWEITK